MSQFKERNQAATVWIGNLDEQVNEELLWELMVQVGPVADLMMPTDKITGLHQSYAFCEFKAEIDAEYCIKVLNGVRLFGKPIKVNRASKDKEALTIGANLYVSNLDREIDDQMLYSTFSVFGNLLEAKVATDENGQSKGYGFVNFSSFESSDNAINSMHGQFLNNRPIGVAYAYKKDGSKGERHGSEAERQLAAKLAATGNLPIPGTSNMQYPGGIVGVPGQNFLSMESQQAALYASYTAAYQSLPQGTALDPYNLQMMPGNHNYNFQPNQNYPPPPP